MILYFTLKQGQAKTLDGFTYTDKVIIEMVSPYPKDAMTELFGEAWDSHYGVKPDTTQYPHGVKQIMYVPKREGFKYGDKPTFDTKSVPTYSLDLS